MIASLEVQKAHVVRGGRPILQNATLQIHGGDFISLLGPNGSGKSTLLRVLAGIWRPDGGSVSLQGRGLSGIGRKEVARKITLVPQDTQADFAFRVEEMVAMGRYPHRGRFTPASARDRKAVQQALRDCDIQHLAARAVPTLSGGERQRVMIARSLAAEPDFILLDEPTANLDVRHTLEILELCRALAANGRAIVLATHDLNIAARFAMRTALMSNGQVVTNGSTADVLSPASINEVFGVRSSVAQAPTGEFAFIFSRNS